jgi:hypothetical protein
MRQVSSSRTRSRTWSRQCDRSSSEGRYSDEHHRYMSWLDGFLTTTNMLITNEPDGIQTDRPAIDVWIRKWCEQNPTKQSIDAAWGVCMGSAPRRVTGVFRQTGKVSSSVECVASILGNPDILHRDRGEMRNVWYRCDQAVCASVSYFASAMSES